MIKMKGLGMWGAIVIIGVMFSAVTLFGWYMITQTTQELSIDVDTTGVPSGDAGCRINPSVVLSVVDTLSPGTEVSDTPYFRLNGIYTGTTSPTTRGSVDILLTASGYINKILPTETLDCGSNPISGSMYAYDNATLSVYADNGLSVLTNDAAGGAYNETAKAAGGSYNWRVHFQGTDKKSTGQQLVVAELSESANVSSLSLSGGTPVTVPNGYSRQISGGYAQAWLIPAVTGNIAYDYNLAAVATTSKIINGAVYTTVYSVEPFVETDGTFSNSGKAFDAINTAKYHDVQTYNFLIA